MPVVLFDQSCLHIFTHHLIFVLLSIYPFFHVSNLVCVLFLIIAFTCDSLHIGSRLRALMFVNRNAGLPACSRLSASTSDGLRGLYSFRRNKTPYLSAGIRCTLRTSRYRGCSVYQPSQRGAVYSCRHGGCYVHPLSASIHQHPCWLVHTAPYTNTRTAVGLKYT